MEFNTVIKERRSIRKFLDKDVSTDVIKSVIDETRYSPSWKNSQPVRYVIIKNKDRKNDLAKNATKDFIYNEKTINRCNSLIIICTNNEEMDKENLSDNEKKHWLSFDAGIATQSFCLSCYNKGISSVILGIFDELKVKKIAKINDNYDVKALIAIGYSDIKNETPARIDVEQLLMIE